MSIAKLYSVGFVIFYGTIYFLCSKMDRSDKFGMAMLLFSILMVSDTFYWIQSELPQGLALLILFFCFLKTYQFKLDNFIPYYVLLYIILLFTLALIHPVIVVPFFFIIVLFYFNNEISKKMLNVSAVLFLFFYIIKSKVLKTEYDTQSLGGLNNFISLFPDYFSIQSNYNFYEYLVSDYYMLLVLLILLTTFYVFKKEYLIYLLIISTFLFYLLLINVSFPQGADQFYIENLYLPLSIFLIFPFVFYVLPNFDKKWVMLFILTVSIIRVTHIWNKHEFYTDRVAFLNETLAQYKDKKVVIEEDEVLNSKLIMSWATPYEFWLLSTIETGVTQSILIIDRVNEVEWALNEKNKFITKWGVFDYNELPDRYFNFKDFKEYSAIRK